MERNRRDQTGMHDVEHGVFEDLLADLSARFVALAPEQVDEEIQRALKEVMNFFGVDRIFLVRLLPGATEWSVTHIADEHGTWPLPRGAVMPVASVPWIAKKYIDREVHWFGSPDELPPEASVDKETLELIETRSALAVPIAALRSSEYTFGFSSAACGKTFPAEHIPRLRLLGELFVNAYERSKIELELRERLEEIQGLKSRLEKENIALRDEIKAEKGFEKVIGDSDALKYVLFRIKQVAPTDATVLILGETGTGKSMVANALHEMSPRKDSPMITVNCAALPANLVESELFGREKGAFTGAQARQAGRFEIAHGGTIFLDEIGEMPLEIQAKLLRVLQDGEFERLGSPRTIKVDVRVIASTARDLKEEVEKKRFREDLFYRLNVFPVSMPPLRMRTGDIPGLVKHFVQKYARKLGRKIETVSKDTMKALREYRWPGNVRELEHVIERAVIISPGPELLIADNLDVKAAGMQEEQPRVLESVEREHIFNVLGQTRWKIEGKNGAAAVLGLNPSTLRFRIKKLGIERP
jgi:formate hydrogenlyase transcriptional activator